MNNIKYLIVIFVLSLFMFHCGTPIEPIVSEFGELSVSEQQLADSGNKFGLKFFRELNKDEIGENVFISPLSISYALGMTYNGSAGETREAMAKSLELQGMSIDEVNQSYKSLMELLTTLDPEVIFEIANSIWYRQGFHVEQKFIDLNKEYFDALVRELDFSRPDAPDIINDWISEKTHGKIEDVIESINPLTMMFLINAIYFKGTWVYEFDPEETKEESFYLIDGASEKVQMMSQRAEFYYYENDLFQAIDLPYGKERFSMTILLPKENEDIDYLIGKLDQNTWNKWISDFPEEKDTVNLFLPRFTTRYDKSLNSVLSALGMDIAFDPGRADFSNINPHRPDLHISNVQHVTFIEVNEEGTEAAAVTVVEMGVGSVGGRIYPTMRVNKPFFFVIRENHSDTLLFMGKIMDPVFRFL